MVANLNRPPTDRSFVVNIVFYGPHWGADLDNLTKLVWDGMKGVFWKDDHQIIESHVMKLRATKDEERTVIDVREIVPASIKDVTREFKNRGINL